MKIRKVRGLSLKHISKFINTYFTLNKIYDITVEELLDIGIKKNVANRLIKLKEISDKSIDEEIKLIKKHNIKILLLEDEEYPEILKNIYDPPAMLYAYGQIETISKPKIAIVGARKSSERGKNFARKIARDLAEVGINVVSGFAAGIDINAHLGAIEKGNTIAVFGCGLLTVYPANNKRYIRDIIENGVILSEYKLTEPPNWHNFPKRNRIISGLSIGTLVVEASKKSGSLITARLALEQNRELFAVPTHPDEFNSSTNFLIKSGAVLVENYLDIIENIPNILDELKTIDKKNEDNIIGFEDDTIKSVYELIAKKPVTSNDLMIEINIGFTDLMSILTELEVNSLIKRGLDGKYYLY